MAFRRLALRLSEAGLASSSTTRLAAAAYPPGASSTSADMLAVYLSEAVLASLGTSTASAARRAAVVCVISAPPRSGLIATLLGAAFASKRKALEQPRLPSAADPAASSSPAASGSALCALYAADWVRSSLDPSSAAAAALGKDPHFLAPPTTASGILLPTAAAARAAAHMPPVAAFISCYPPSRFARGCSTCCWELNDSSLEQTMMLRTLMSLEDNVILRTVNLSQKIIKVAVVRRYMQSNLFTSDELIYMLRALKDDDWQANVDAKLDDILLMVGKSDANILKLLEVLDSNKSGNWTTIVIGGKKIELSSWMTYALSIIFGSPMP